MKSLPKLVTLVTLSLISSLAYSGSIEIQFSGVFRACKSVSSCDGTLLGNLVDTPFSGTIVFPEAASPTFSDNGIAGDSDRSIYVIDGSDAHFSITTNEPQLNLNNHTPVSISVNDCVEIQCAMRDDYVWFEISKIEFSYTLIFNSSSGQFLNGSSIPDLNTLKNMSATAGFTIYRSDLSREVNSFDSSGSFNVLTINIRKIPDPSSNEGCYVVRAKNGNVITFCL